MRFDTSQRSLPSYTINEVVSSRVVTMGNSNSTRNEPEVKSKDATDDIKELKKEYDAKIRILQERIIEEQRRNISGQQSTATTSEPTTIEAGGVTEDDLKGPLRIVVALHSHVASETAELTFEKGTKFGIIDESDPDWLLARDLATQQTGYVSVNYVCDATSLEAQDWYFGDLKRVEAERVLMSNISLHSGAFLIRNSETSYSKFHKYTLSVKMSVPGPPNNATDLHYNEETEALEVIVVKHYKIYNNSNGFFKINNQLTFRTLQDFVGFYHGLGTGPNGRQQSLLTVVCPKPRPTFYDLSCNTRLQWEIPLSSLEFLVMVGSGNFGEVWQGKYNCTREVAIKKLKPGTTPVEEFRREASIMKMLHHPHIVTLFAVCTEDASSILIITEYMNKGSLKKVLEDEGPRISLPELLEICTQVASGMAYLEEQRYIHRDLAARNVLVDTNKYCKVADFGLTRNVDNGLYKMTTDVPLAWRWLAPESLREKIFSSKSDVWAFGILMMEVLTLGGNPYPELQNNQQVEHKVTRGYRMKRPTSPVYCPDWLFDEIILKCWMEDPDQRVSFSFLEEQLSMLVSINIEYDEDSEMHR